MCDPISAAIGVVGGFAASKVLTPKAPTASVAPTTDPAKERAAAEAEAQQSANRKLAEDQRRRRGQASLMSSAAAAASPSLGDSTSTDTSPLSRGIFRDRGLSGLRARVDYARSVAMGTTPAASGPSPLGGGGGGSGGGGGRTSQQAY